MKNIAIWLESEYKYQITQMSYYGDCDLGQLVNTFVALDDEATRVI